MEDISLFFTPVDFNTMSFKNEMLGERVYFHTADNFPELTEKGIAILFVPEYRKSKLDNDLDLEGVKSVRTKLYQLYDHFDDSFSLYDLGTILPGETYNDTVKALSASVTYLIKKNILPVVIGGSQDLTFSIYNAYKELELLINLTTLDSNLDLGDEDEELHADGWLKHILTDKSCYLFNYSNIGAQGHYLPKSQLNLFEELYFDVNRLGALLDDIKVVEPVLRNTDLFSFDCNSIKKSDFCASSKLPANGVNGFDACKISRYAGISDKLSSFGMFNIDFSKLDASDADLITQVIWYFIEGYSNRKGDFPKGSKKNYKKFRVTTQDFDDELIFYKSDKSARWWMEVPYPSTKGSKFQRHQLVPCNLLDYEQAMKGELPDLWWKTYQKLSV